MSSARIDFWQGTGGNVGSTGGDVDLDTIKDAAKILQNLINQLSE